jgi:hypothetical protein
MPPRTGRSIKIIKKLSEAEIANLKNDEGGVFDKIKFKCRRSF